MKDRKEQYLSMSNRNRKIFIMKDGFETDINKEIITCLFDYLFILIKGI